ncbi:phosphatase PAP2 family protein [Sorangium sp. So ce1078]|uniref:phosphatase PAP2 family protein n=1 Tax=Sorangium sp. So ce1078 TaxID=3133329 RepID=UPI003F61759E
MRAVLAATTLSALLVSLSPAGAAEPSPELTFVPEVDLPLTVVGGAAWAASELAKKGLAPDACRWCAVGPLDASVRDALLWSGNPGTAHDVSNVTVLAVAPVSALGLTAFAAWHDGRTENMAADLLIVTEAMVVAMGLNQLTKYAVGRQRPYAHFENPDVLYCEGAGCARPLPHDDDLSFFSGHSTAAFSLAAASGTVASMRGYRAAPWVWAQGMALAALSGYLRIASDRHYFTDVLTGAALGSAAGVLIPYLFHGPRAGVAGPDTRSFRLSLAPAIGGARAGVAGTF